MKCAVALSAGITCLQKLCSTLCRERTAGPKPFVQSLECIMLVFMQARVSVSVS